MKTKLGKYALMLSALLWFSNAFADTYAQRLDRILDEYKALPESTDVRRLVELDRELTALAEEIQKDDREGKSAKMWKEEYEEIGIYVGHYSGQIGYSGKLLVEAHVANPNSPYREPCLRPYLARVHLMVSVRCPTSSRRRCMCRNSPMACIQHVSTQYSDRSMTISRKS